MLTATALIEASASREANMMFSRFKDDVSLSRFFRPSHEPAAWKRPRGDDWSPQNTRFCVISTGPSSTERLPDYIVVQRDEILRKRLERQVVMSGD